jgi:hypothetical protein
VRTVIPGHGDQDILDERFGIPEKKCVHIRSRGLGIPGRITSEENDGIVGTTVRAKRGDSTKRKESQGTGKGQQTRGKDDQNIEPGEWLSVGQRERRKFLFH